VTAFYPPRYRLASRTKSAHQIDDKTYQQNQTKPSPSDHGATEVKTASAKQKKKNKYEQYWIHA
jgi:hypothetical protein